MYENLIRKAQGLRQKTFQAFVEHGEAHLGGSFSMIEMLLALYENVLQEEDKFILSKAHASFPLCLLLQEKGLHPELRTHLELDPENGIYCTTGSLGHGLPIAAGMAMARKRLGQPGRVFVMISDGECQEGTTWESMLIGAKHELDNLVLLVDYNKVQALTTVNDALPLENLSAKFKAFNWECEEIMDGHAFDQLVPALEKMNSLLKPRVLIVHTIKGRGIRAFENDPAWHARKIKGKDLQIGEKELGLT